MTSARERDDLGWLVTSDPDDARAAIDDAILDAANMLDTLGRGVVALVSIGAADPMFDAGRVEATAQRARDAVASITAHVEAEVARRLAAAPGVEDAIWAHNATAVTLGQASLMFADADLDGHRVRRDTSAASPRAAIAADKARAVDDARSRAVADFIDTHAKRRCEAAGEVWDRDSEEAEEWASDIHDMLNTASATWSRAVEGMRPVLSLDDADRLVASFSSAFADYVVAGMPPGNLRSAYTSARAALIAALTGNGGGR